MKTEDAIKYFGSKAEIARVLGVGRSAISTWGDKIPPRWACQIHLITKGKVKASASDIRPTSSLRRYRPLKSKKRASSKAA